MGAPRPALDRFHEKLDRTGDCWLWTGARSTSGYARLRVDGRSVDVHRWAYGLFVGPIPDGLQLDHLCRVRHCVRPSHLEPVTQVENMRRGRGIGVRNSLKTHCPQGHEYTPDNTLNEGGARRCRICRARTKQRSYRRMVA